MREQEEIFEGFEKIFPQDTLRILFFSNDLLCNIINKTLKRRVHVWKTLVQYFGFLLWFRIYLNFQSTTSDTDIPI